MVRLSKHLLLCSKGASTRNAPLPVVPVHTYLHGGAMRSKRHYTQLAQAIALSLCGYRRHTNLWAAVHRTPPRDWSQVVLLLDLGGATVIDWGDIILVDYSDREGWGQSLTALVLRELNLIAMKGIV